MHRNSFDEHAEVLAKTRENCSEPLERLIAKVSESLAAGGKILFFGNGGSASDAQHLAAELSVRFVKTRRALAGLALGSSIAEATACANDFGFERVFARQIEAIGAAGDVAIGLSTSGNSANVVAAVQEARKRGIFTAAFTGQSGGALKEAADLLIAVPSTVTARIQEMHSLLGHILCEGIERELKL
ncbi:MAG TPA: SIS domain-containing protein [Bryobacteraceae bacterium]|nr:SIS domain-containing protein [Bryobacteraceae bacterium]